MASKKSKKYAIIDIETSGGMYNRDKITEIAVFVTDGHELLDSFHSLINPERAIPSQITRLTGIDNKLVANAPKFYEIAKDLVRITEGCIFVAHNVKFDYNFIKEEFRSLGFAYNRKQLCTVKLTKSIIPGLSSYGLDSLIEYFDIDIKDRHRAYDDALATFEIFRYLISHTADDFHVDQLINGGLDASILPRGLDIEEVHNVPESPGVYYFKDNLGEIFYVGKAINIQSRIFQHFRELSNKSIHIYGRVSGLDYFETGSELLALLLELKEIRSHNPPLNKAMRNTYNPYAIYAVNSSTNKNHIFNIYRNIEENDHKGEKIKVFSSKHSAERYVQALVEDQGWCAALFNSRKRPSCQCNGACYTLFNLQEEDKKEMIRLIRNDFEKDFVILTEGRNIYEHGFALIREKRFWGIGFIDKSTAIRRSKDWLDYVVFEFFHPETHAIIKLQLEKKRFKLINLG